jgi:diguanylate cyclase (GGDEF)-like protein
VIQQLVPGSSGDELRGSPVVRWVRRWWLLSDRFDWFTMYLDDRGLLCSVRLSVACVTATFALVAAAMLWSPAGPTDPWPRAADGAAAITGAILAAMWAIAWPSLNQSRFYVIAGNACVAVACLAQDDPLVGLTGCYAFVVLGGYVALMHCARATAYNVAVSIAVACVLSWRVADRGGDVVLAACELVVLALFSVGAPVGLQAMMHVMAVDVVGSDRDALTGLLNRRGFYRNTTRLIERHAHRRDGHLTITMIDLDDFKRINDTHGHAAGDQTLIDVGQLLGEHTSPHAVVARVGGEEFLVADVAMPDEQPAAQRLCTAIATTSPAVTASVGTTSVPIARLDGQDRTVLIDTLVVHADDAMYAAKNDGGNRHRHHREPDALDTPRVATSGS